MDEATETNPFQDLVDSENVVRSERNRCAAVVQEALDEAASRGLHESSPVVKILARLKHKIEIV